jgi:hypothetical protein
MENQQIIDSLDNLYTELSTFLDNRIDSGDQNIIGLRKDIQLLLNIKNSTIISLRKDELMGVLNRAYEYVSSIADADYIDGTMVPNEAMRLQSTIDDLLYYIGSKGHGDKGKMTADSDYRPLKLQEGINRIKSLMSEAYGVPDAYQEYNDEIVGMLIEDGEDPRGELISSVKSGVYREMIRKNFLEGLPCEMSVRHIKNSWYGNR